MMKQALSFGSCPSTYFSCFSAAEKEPLSEEQPFLGFYDNENQFFFLAT